MIPLPLAILYVVLCTLKSVDVITTEAALSEGAREANPVTAFMMKVLKSYWWVADGPLVLAPAYVGLWALCTYGSELYACIAAVIACVIQAYPVYSNGRLIKWW